MVALDVRGSRLTKTELRQNTNEAGDEEQVGETMLLEEQRVVAFSLVRSFHFNLLVGVVLFQKREPYERLVFGRAPNKEKAMNTILQFDLSYYAVFLAGLLPYIFTGFAKFGSGRTYNNHDPRAFLEQAEGQYRRANNAQLNSLKRFLFCT